MTILDATVVNVALPTLGRDFRASFTAIQWIPAIHLLAFASVIPDSGWASERFGAKRVWLASLAAFMAVSLLCGLSGSLPELIASRSHCRCSRARSGWPSGWPPRSPPRPLGRRWRCPEDRVWRVPAGTDRAWPDRG